jgi:protoporphyrinogen oxidase
MTTRQKAIIIGAGPAGLTAAFELLERTDIVPMVIEASDNVGGISRTYVFKGNRLELGGHRFFSKSDRVMAWWQRFLPVEAGDSDGTDDDRMLVRKRVSRILFRGKLFDYPLTLSPATVGKLGLAATARAGFSYIGARLFPIRPERTLEEFVVNRFGRYLFSVFFKEYTEKVWGVECKEIPADWGAQRIKGVSVSRVLRHALRKLLTRGDTSIGQKSTETSLIERFLYPKHGPGQMWETVAERVRERGGDVVLNTRAQGIEVKDGRVVAVTVEDGASGEARRLTGDYFFSTMPVRELIAGLTPPPPEAVREVAEGLMYRDFMTVGILARRLCIGGGVSGGTLAKKLPDNWIYVQEPGVAVGRIQVYNNWSPHMVADPETVWLGMEFFVNETDALWTSADHDVVAVAVAELEKLGFVAADDVIDALVVRQKKAYPAYFGTYARLGEIRHYLSTMDNLFLLGRNGQHRYNNQDHSMLTAMTAVDGIAAGAPDHDAVWRVNTEDEYHEET